MTYNEAPDMTQAAIEALERAASLAGTTTCEQATEPESAEEAKAREAKRDEDYEFDKGWKTLEANHGVCGV